MSGYQGHGSVAHPHGILITWAVITEGGFQVDAQGRRFGNEATGYSEQAEAVLAKAQARPSTSSMSASLALRDSLRIFARLKPQAP